MLQAQVFICIGFMMAILYLDLQFDMLALPSKRAGGPDPAGPLGQIATYYGVVTKNPYLLMFVMMTCLVSIIFEIVYGLVPAWAGYSSLAFMLAAMLGGVVLVIPKAQRLSSDKDPLEVRTKLAFTMFPSHIFLLVMIWSLAFVQAFGAK